MEEKNNLFYFSAFCTSEAKKIDNQAVCLSVRLDLFADLLVGTLPNGCWQIFRALHIAPNLK